MPMKRAGRRKQQSRNVSSRALAQAPRQPPPPPSLVPIHRLNVERELAKISRLSAISIESTYPLPTVIKFIVVYHGSTILLRHGPIVHYFARGYKGVIVNNRLYQLFPAHGYYFIDLASEPVKTLSKGFALPIHVRIHGWATAPRTGVPAEQLSNSLDNDSDRAFLRKHFGTPVAILSAPSDARVSAILRSLPTRESSQLKIMWHNAVKALGDGRFTKFTKSDVMLIIQTIEAEWSGRNTNSLGAESFEWPSTDAPKSSLKVGSFEVQGEGMLAYLEYHVGKSSELSTSARRSILDRVFRGSLPAVFPKVYMDQWGKPGSARRLQKTAECIAAFVRNFKRRENENLQQAIDEWEADLAWLYVELYVGHFRFAWPLSEVSSQAPNASADNF